MERTKYLSEKEVLILRTTTKLRALEAAEAKPKRVGGILMWMVVDAALSTGLRVGELVKIRVIDIDFKRSFINVCRLKKGKPYKDILAISPEFKQHLKDYLGKRSKGKLFKGKRGNLTRQGLQQIWKAAIKRANLPKEYSIHAARHSAAVQYLRKTKNLKLVQKLLGHSSITTTAQMYCDIPFEDMQEAATGVWD